MDHTFIHNMVSLAGKIVGGLMVTVTVSTVKSRDAYGKPAYNAPTTRKAVFGRGKKSVKTEMGREIVSESQLTFLDGLDVSTTDKLMMDGIVRPIVNVKAMMDPAGKPYAVEVWL